MWLVDNMMGPCSVWLTEALTDVMPLAAGDHVLDLGCGKAMSSIFLAREFNTHVVAADLWIAADENQRRIDDAGLAASITPIHLDANQLDLPDETFDAIVSIDAYHYFGAEPGTLDGHRSAPATRRQDRRHRSRRPHGDRRLARTPRPLVARRLRDVPQPSVVGRPVDTAKTSSPRTRRPVPHGAEDWLTWTEAWDDWARANDRAPYELESQMLRADRDQLLGFTRLVATKT